MSRLTMGARALAITVLARVAQSDGYLNVVLDHALSEHPLDEPRDAALVTELAYGATRRLMALDAALAPLCARPLAQLEERVLWALRLGAYQLFFTRVPRHAAVSATVDALKELRLSRAAGLVNAVLRRLASHDALPAPDGDAIDRLAIRESHPAWLCRRWVTQFGYERAEQMLRADNEPPRLTVRVNGARTSREVLLGELLEAGVQATAARTSPRGIVLTSPGRVDELYGYREGLWQVQDEAAQLVVVFADLPEGGRVLDACAAPGGKACQLAERHDVLAVDLYPNKLTKLVEEATRLGVRGRIETLAHDFTAPLTRAGAGFDAVLLDAPCTGLGTLRRHPELRYRRTEEDIARLVALQRRLLENAQAQVKPGGLLVYSVCSVEPQEGVDQMEVFLRTHPDFTSEPPSLGAPLPLHQGFLRTLPGEEGHDGFFAARLRRLHD